MTAKDWDALADEFSSRVLEISKCDIHGVIKATAKRLGGARNVATDFGCGAGGVTRLIAPYFKSVTGVDYSPKLIRAARAKTRVKNIAYETADLQLKRARLFPCDVAFCANVLIDENAMRRERIACNVIASVKNGGRAVFIVPSLEAVMRTYQVALQFQPERNVQGWVKDELVSLPRGVVYMGGAPTKHYLKDEIAEFLTTLKLRDVSIRRVSYPWREVLDGAPRKLKAAPPWDWIAVGMKS